MWPAGDGEHGCVSGLANGRLCGFKLLTHFLRAKKSKYDKIYVELVFPREKMDRKQNELSGAGEMTHSAGKGFVTKHRTRVQIPNIPSKLGTVLAIWRQEDPWSSVTCLVQPGWGAQELVKDPIPHPQARAGALYFENSHAGNDVKAMRRH